LRCRQLECPVEEPVVDTRVAENIASFDFFAAMSAGIRIVSFGGTLVVAAVPDQPGASYVFQACQVCSISRSRYSVFGWLAFALL
jgi:hypothetical protein